MRRSSPFNRACRIWPSAFALFAAACAQSGPPPPPPLPEGALEVVSADPGVNRESLARAVDALFTREGIGETRALVVLHRGAVAAERYGEGSPPKRRWSAGR